MDPPKDAGAAAATAAASPPPPPPAQGAATPSEAPPGPSEASSRPSEAPPEISADAAELILQEATKEEPPSVVPSVIEEPPKKKRNFKRKPDALPDEYKQLKGIPEVDKEKHTQRWLKAQEMRRGLVRPQRKNEALNRLKYTSHTYYNNMWAEAQVELRALLKEERTRGSLTGSDKKKMFALLSEVYQKYLSLYKKLDETYDQMVHPQKRILVRKLLDTVIGRLLEVRKSLVAAEESEYFYFDELTYIQRIPPEDMDIPIPKYYYHDPSEQTLQRDKWYDNIQRRKDEEDSNRLESEKKALAKKLAEDNEWMLGGDLEGDEEGGGGERKYDFGGGHMADIAGSILLIQKMERARQARNRFRIAKYMVEEESRALKKKKKKKGQTMDTNKAVIIIQKLVRGFLARVKVKRLREEELDLLGLKFSTPGDQSQAGQAYLKCVKTEEELGKSRERRRQDRRRNQKIYEEAQVTIEQRLKLLEGPEMAERFKFQIRTWMLDFKEKTGKLPKMIPKWEQGGSRFFICPNQLPEEIMQKGKEATDKEYAKKMKAERKKEKKKLKEQRKKDKKKAMKGVLDLSTQLDPPTQMDDMISYNVEYNKIWRGRDESENTDQMHEEKFIIHEKRKLISEDVRKVVDKAMIAELKVLKDNLERKKKKGKKGKKGKHGKHGPDDDASQGSAASMASKRKARKRSAKSHLKKKKKKGKKGKGKDLTKNTPMEFLFAEFLKNGIVRRYPEIRMSSLVGSVSLINGEIRDFFSKNPLEAKHNEERPMPGDANPLPSFGDIKRAIKDICILPMGSTEVHAIAPRVKSVLLCGPEGSGKRTFVNAVATELHATMFDLTATNIAGKYPGKKGLKMLLHMIDKVGKAVAPTIIVIDNCENTYAKKIPKAERSPLKKAMAKMLNKFSPGDQMMLIGLSQEPWKSKAKFFKRDYQRVIYIPKPDYGSRMEVWRSLLVPHAAYMHKDVHFSLLNKLSDGYTIGTIRKVVNTVVGNHRKVLDKEAKDKMYRDEEATWTMMEPGGKTGSIMGKTQIRMDQFLDELSNYDPVFMEMDKAWNKFFNKTPLQKQRLASLAAGLEKDTAKGKKGAKGGKGKGPAKGKAKGKRK